MLEGIRPERKGIGVSESKSQYERLEDVEEQSPVEEEDLQETSTSGLHRLHCLHCCRALQGLPRCAITLKEGLWNSGMGCMAAASFLQSLGGLSVKITNGRVPVFEIVLIRSSLCMAISIGMIIARGISPVFGSRANFLPLFVRGAAGAASMSLYYFAILQMTLAEVMTVFYTHPAMVVALAWACRGEAVSRAALGGMLASLVGVVVVAQPPFLTGGSEWSAQHVSGVVDSLLAALLAAIAFVAIRFVSKGESSLSIALWFHTMGVVTSIVPLAVGKPDHAVLPSVTDSALLFLVAFCSFTSHTFIARAFQVENAAKSAAAGYLQVVFGYLYGVFIFHDSHSIVGVLGSALICVGVVAVSWPAKGTIPSETQPADLVEASKRSTLALQDYTVLELTPVDEEEHAPETPPPLPTSKVVPRVPT